MYGELKFFNLAVLNVLKENFRQLYIQDKTKYTLDHNTWTGCFKMYMRILIDNFDTCSSVTNFFIHDSL